MKFNYFQRSKDTAREKIKREMVIKKLQISLRWNLNQFMLRQRVDSFFPGGSISWYGPFFEYAQFDFFPQPMLGGFSFRAGVCTMPEVRKICRNTPNQTIRLKNVPDQVAKTCRGRFLTTVSHFCYFSRLQKRAQVGDWTGSGRRPACGDQTGSGGRPDRLGSATRPARVYMRKKLVGSET